jgi:hypothetical protein
MDGFQRFIVGFVLLVVVLAMLGFLYASHSPR